MAETVSITRPAPVLEASLTNYLKALDPLVAPQINTAAYAPKIAAESALQQQARTAAGGLGSLVGPQAYQPFMSPYQQEVIDTTLTEFDRQQAINQTGLRDAAIQSGAFGGARQGLGTYQTQLGQAGQAQQQAILDAATGAAREAEFEPFTRLGLVGQQLAQVQPGAFPTQTVGYQPPAAPASPLSTALGVGTGIASIGSKLGLFG